VGSGPPGAPTTGPPSPTPSRRPSLAWPASWTCPPIPSRAGPAWFGPRPPPTARASASWGVPGTRRQPSWMFPVGRAGTPYPPGTAPDTALGWKGGRRPWRQALRSTGCGSRPRGLSREPRGGPCRRVITKDLHERKLYSYLYAILQMSALAGLDPACEVPGSPATEVRPCPPAT